MFDSFLHDEASYLFLKKTCEPNRIIGIRFAQSCAAVRDFRFYSSWNLVTSTPLSVYLTIPEPTHDSPTMRQCSGDSCLSKTQITWPCPWDGAGHADPGDQF
jgi:hypothetical protein